MIDESETGTGLIEIMECYCNRDDAKDAGKMDEYWYWRGYIAAHCDAEHLDPETTEGEYRRIMQVAAHGEYGMDNLPGEQEA